ncbi:hypothetical protein AAZX31_18G154100 [Glycine max]
MLPSASNAFLTSHYHLRRFCEERKNRYFKPDSLASFDFYSKVLHIATCQSFGA